MRRGGRGRWWGAGCAKRRIGWGGIVVGRTAGPFGAKPSTWRLVVRKKVAEARHGLPVLRDGPNMSAMSIDPSEASDWSGLLADAALRRGLTRFVRRRVPALEVEDIVQATLTEALASRHQPDEAKQLQRGFLPAPRSGGAGARTG